jgi:hypothetical protein
MPELEDLRGRHFHWSVRSERPLDCRIYEGAREVGIITHGLYAGLLGASFAGIEWTIRTEYRNQRLLDQVRFTNGPTWVAEAWVESRPGGELAYVLAIDEFEIYRLPRPVERQTGWFDEANRLAASIRETGLRGESGEIEVLDNAVLPHAPILVLMAAYRDGRSHQFFIP